MFQLWETFYFLKQEYILLVLFRYTTVIIRREFIRYIILERD